MELFAATSAGGDAWDDFGEPTTLWSGAGAADFPAVAAGPAAGDFRVVWQAATDGGQNRWNTWVQETSDGGETWRDSPLRLSDQANGASYKHAEGYAFPYGDYLGLAVDGEGVAHAIWGEGPSWDGPGGTWSTRQAP